MTSGLTGRLEAVTFDYWNTLVFEEPVGNLRDRRVAAWLGVLEEAGVPVSHPQMHAAFEASWERYVAAWEANRQYRSAEAIQDIVASLDLSPPDEVLSKLVDGFHGAMEDAQVRPTPGIGECLRRLKGSGLKLGIVCDVGMTHSPALRGLLDRQGLLELFDHCSFSDEVGAYKPSPVIFKDALEGLGGVDPARVAHVGDRRRTDVAGALAMGMVAVRYAGIFDDQSDGLPDGAIVIHDYRELPSAAVLA